MKLTANGRKRLQTLTTILLVLTVVAIIFTLAAWIVSEPGSFEPLNVLFFAALSLLTAASAWLGRADNVAPPKSSAVAAAETIPLGPLRGQIADRFDLNELRTLCLDIGINYDSLSGDTIEDKAASLLAYMQRRGQLPKLMAALQQERPQVNWPLPAQLQSQYSLRRNVYATWIEGILKQSVTAEIALELNLTYQPHTLTRKVTYIPGQVERPVDRPLKMVLADHGSLLILGEPGSGKTITLLQLAEALLDEGEVDLTMVAPAIFNLSSWAVQQRPLAEWLVEEFLLQYQTPRQTSRQWVMEDRLVLLLDGLDEVAAEARAACVAAINTFQAEHNTPIVVCCRAKEYQALPVQLNVGMAVRIQPLSQEEVDEFLARPELGLTAVQKMMQTDEVLQELAQTPLFLSVMTLAYRHLTISELEEMDTVAARRAHLYHHYVTQMLARRPLAGRTIANDEQALAWLVNLAYGMQQHEQSVFYIEQLQPTWLRTRSLSYRLFVGLIAGLIGGLLFGVSIGVVIRPYIGLVVGLIGGLIVGYIGGERAGKEPIILYEQLRWLTASAQEIWEAAKGAFVFSITYVVILGLGLGIILGFIFGWQVGLLVWLVIVVAGTLVSVMMSILLQNIQSRETNQRLTPNQGIRNSVWNALRMGLIVGLIYGLSVGIVLGIILTLVFPKSVGVFTGLILGICGGLSGGLMEYGGQTVVRHYAMRWLLNRQSILPFPFQDKLLIAYLDALTGCILLRRVGGGWVFIHRTLLDYFAALHPDAMPTESVILNPTGVKNPYDAE